ncbi:unnamed protein product [Fraxinus pennsylvanica]|uniref:Uncharacterized protein n=1 Tax=Fraxinus pennsylvanica TaxID=56036 RepID=A0AAD1YYS7_9LAMI|nr:unnamed protein product [Fraxinus pennsylvanica]
MNFQTPVDDYCRAWQAFDLDVPKIKPSNDGDHFFIEVHMEKTYFPLEEEEDDDELNPDYLLDYDCDTSISPFWEPCGRVEHNNLPLNRISKILCEVGVPLHRQGFMMHRISEEADEIANAPFNKNKKILSMIVSISIVAVKPILNHIRAKCREGDHFFIEYFPLEEEDEEMPDYLLDYDSYKSISTFWEPCVRVEQNNLPLNRISKILCEVGVPLHGQGFMLDEILAEADKIANKPYNKNKKIFVHVPSDSQQAYRSDWSLILAPVLGQRPGFHYLGADNITFSLAHHFSNPVATTTRAKAEPMQSTQVILDKTYCAH